MLIFHVVFFFPNSFEHLATYIFILVRNYKYLSCHLKGIRTSLFIQDLLIT